MRDAEGRDAAGRPAAAVRRERSLVLSAWALGALGLVVVGGQPWGSAAPNGLGQVVEVPAPAAVRALGLAALAAVAVLPLLRRGRRLLGAVGVLLAGAAFGVALAGRPPVTTGWPWVAAACAAVVAAAAAVTVLRAGEWVGSGRRFEALAGEPSTAHATAGDDPASARETWDALDRGEDPTTR